MTNLLDAVAVLLFSSQGRWFMRAFDIEKNLRLAGISMHPLVFSSRAMMIFHIVMIMSFSIATYVYLSVPSLVVAVLSISMASIASLAAFTAPLLRISLGISSRRNNTEFELPFFTVYAAIMARGMVPMYRAFERFADSVFFRAIRREAERYLVERRILGRDPVTAMESVAKNHPSTMFRDLIMSYITVLRIGGDLSEHLARKADELFERFEERIRRMASRITTAMEIYVATVIIGGVATLILLYLSGGVAAARGSASVGYAPLVFTYFVLPALNIVMVIYLHLASPRRYVEIARAPIVMLRSSAAAVIIFIAALLISGGYRVFQPTRIGKLDVIAFIASLALSLAAIAIPVWISYRRERMEQRTKLNDALTEFLEDVASNRRVGLSIERSIELLMNRDYGILSPVIRTMGIAIRVGLSLENAAITALRGVRSWFARVVFGFLVDSVVLGGGSSEVISDLARYAKAMAEFEKRVYTSLRAYMFVPYIAVATLAISVFATTYMVTQSATLFGRTIDLDPIYRFMAINIAGVLINSFLAGIVTGKASEQSIFAGAKHSAATIAIAAAISIATTTLMIP